MAELKRNIGTFGAASVGIANIIGSGIFVLSGVASDMANTKFQHNADNLLKLTRDNRQESRFMVQAYEFQ